MKLLWGRLQCWWQSRHIWSRAYPSVSLNVLDDINEPTWSKHCKRCGYGQSVKRRAK